MEYELTVRGSLELIQAVAAAVSNFPKDEGDGAPQSGSSVTPPSQPTPPAAASPNSSNDVEAVRRVRARCGKTWPYVQKIAAVFQTGDQLSLAEIAERTKIPMRKVHSIWNVLGRPLKSQRVAPFFVWVKGTRGPKEFTLSAAAKAEILKP